MKVQTGGLKFVFLRELAPQIGVTADMAGPNQQEEVCFQFVVLSANVKYFYEASTFDPIFTVRVAVFSYWSEIKPGGCKPDEPRSVAPISA